MFKTGKTGFGHWIFEFRILARLRRVNFEFRISKFEFSLN